MLRKIIILLLCLSNSIASSSSLDNSFQAIEIDGTVTSMHLQQDNKIIIMGGFTNVGNSPQNGIARLNTDGSLDSSFNFTLNRFCSLKLQADDKILGVRTIDVNGVTRCYLGNSQIVRIKHDGTVDDSFNSDLFDTIYSIHPQADGKILVHAERDNIFRLNADGSVDSSFNFNSPISGCFPVGEGISTVALQADGKVVLGGCLVYRDNQSFTSSGLLRLNIDGTVDTSFRRGSGLHSVESITPLANGDNIVVAQRSEHGSDSEVFSIDSSGSLKTHFLIDRASALVDQSGDSVLLGGYFNNSQNIILRLYTEGSRVRSVNTGFDGQLFDIKLQTDGKILMATNVFNADDSPPLRRLVRLNANASLVPEDEVCIPIKMRNGHLVAVCL